MVWRALCFLFHVLVSRPPQDKPLRSAAQEKSSEVSYFTVFGLRVLWRRMCDSADETFPMSHDGYIMLFQFHCPHIGPDI